MCVETVVLGGVTSMAGNGVQGPPEPPASPSATAETMVPGARVSVGGLVQPQNPIIPFRVRDALASL
jgi:hypothetical protein